jgi:hypothetical protein
VVTTKTQPDHPAATTDRFLRRKVALAAIAVSGLGMLLSACGGPSAGALQGKSATDVVSLSITALHHQRSFHFVSKTVNGAQTQIQIGDVSNSSAAESVQSGSHPILDAVLVDGVSYLRAGTKLLESALDLSVSAANAHAGTWLAIEKGDAAYSEVVDSLSATSAIEFFVPEEPHLHVAGIVTFSGTNALAVEGSSAAAPSNGDVGNITLFVSTLSPFLPLGATLVVTDRAGRVVERDAALFGKWNERVAPRIPRGATPLSSIIGG